MDMLTLLRELYGEEPIRKIVSSGFDSAGKIAAATSESLSFFAGINEPLARQIIASAEETLRTPVNPGYRNAPGRATPRATTPRSQESKEPSRSRPLDESPVLDSGELLRGVASETRPQGLLGMDILENIGLSETEADLLEGTTPWSVAGGDTASSEPPLEPVIPPLPEPEAKEKEVDLAPVSSWSPDEDPDPIPRIVRAPELGPDPGGPGPAPEPEKTAPAESHPAESSPSDAETSPSPSSFWRFGK